MKHRTVITPAAEPAQAGGRAAVPARAGMVAPSGLFAAMTAVAGLATGRRTRVPEGRPVVLRDGSAVLIRQVRSADAPLLADGFARLSAASRQMRFLGVKKELSAAELRYLPTSTTTTMRRSPRWTGPADTAWASPAMSGMPTTRRRLRSRSPSSMTGTAGDWAPSCWLSCPTAPAPKESAASPPWPTPITWPWPLCSATPAPASYVVDGAPSSTRSR